MEPRLVTGFDDFTQLQLDRELALVDREQGQADRNRNQADNDEHAKHRVTHCRVLLSRFSISMRLSGDVVRDCSESRSSSWADGR